MSVLYCYRNVKLNHYIIVFIYLFFRAMTWILISGMT